MRKRKVSMTTEQHRKFYAFIVGDDMDFYEEYIMVLSNKEQLNFFNDNPDFMIEFHVNRDRIYLLKDKIFRSILRKIKEYEGRSENVHKEI